MEDRTRFEALLASTECEIKEIAERQGSLAERLDRSEARLNQSADLLGQVAIHVAVLDARVNALETRGHGSETQVRTIETRIDAFASELDALDAKLNVRVVDAPERTEHIECPLGRGGRARPERRKQRSASKRFEAAHVEPTVRARDGRRSSIANSKVRIGQHAAPRWLDGRRR